MKLALVALPWSTSYMPSPALGLLSAEVKCRRPDVAVRCFFPYIEVVRRIGLERYNAISVNPILGETLYAAHLYPEKLPDARQHLGEWIETHEARDLWNDRPLEATLDAVFDAVAASIADTSSQLADGYDVVGFTTTFAQLFASLNVARALKRERPESVVVLGGMSVAFDSGASLLQEYPFLDCVVQGDGEERLLSLLGPDGGRGYSGGGVLFREDAACSRDVGARSTFQVLEGEVKQLDALPLPDYDDFAEEARRMRIPWTVPIEGSRGCWWDRVARTNDPMKICYFCGLNSTTYREKSVARLVREIEHMSERHGITRFQFLDNIIRHDGIHELSRRICSLDKDLWLFYEVRANIKPHELLDLWEAGCYKVQIGIEGLSSAYLKRIGKGTTVIQNLQAMRTCFELGIDASSNLLTHFPGTPQSEIDETTRNILSYAIGYQPLVISPFGLYEGSSVARLPERFGVSGLRNSHRFAPGLPADVLGRVRLHFLDYDEAHPQQDWSAAQDACVKWREVHRRLLSDSIAEDFYIPVRPLTYRDGGTFMEISDRVSAFSHVRLDQLQRDIYLYCMQIRSCDDVIERFGAGGRQARAERILQTFCERRLMFAEGGRCLSLAVATTPEIAARRIRKEQARAEAARPSRKPLAFEVVA